LKCCSFWFLGLWKMAEADEEAAPQGDEPEVEGEYLTVEELEPDPAGDDQAVGDDPAAAADDQVAGDDQVAADDAADEQPAAGDDQALGDDEAAAADDQAAASDDPAAAGDEQAALDEPAAAADEPAEDAEDALASSAGRANDQPPAESEQAAAEEEEEEEPPEEAGPEEAGEEEPGDEEDEGEAELERQMHEDEEEEGEPVEEGPDPMVELQEKLAQLLDQNDRLKGKNGALQRAVINRRARDKSYDASEKQSEGKVTEHKYQNMLNNVHSERMKLRLQQVMAARMSDELKNQLEAKRQKAIECRDSFQEFKRQIARHAEYARTGKKIQEKIIQEVEEFELDKDAEVEEVRGSNISLKNRLAKLEQALRNKDELAENLHVIDFEQLKIENQQLNEKIEERNEELHKLRKKTVVTVQIITHMREKVQFVQKEYQETKEKLATLDQDLGAQRDLVTKTKHERDEHRQEYAALKQQTGIMNSEHLTKDFKDRADRIKELKDQFTQLKKRHGQMSQFIKAHGGKI